MRVSTLWLLTASTLAHAALLPTPVTISPCPAANTAVAPPPITVTAQYQPVSTCVTSSRTCAKWRCRTEYSYQTYDFVSTVIPCPFGTSSVSTITVTDQSVLVSRTTTTVTSITTKAQRPSATPRVFATYTTVVKEWSAVYKDLGPIAIPGYAGSGLSKNKDQELEVVECQSSHHRPTICKKWRETWILIPAPTSTSTARAVCSSRTVIPSVGVYTFAFPQRASATIRVPGRTVTYTNGPKVVTTTIIETVTVITKDWTAFVTRHCRPSVLDFHVTVTTTIYYTVPPFTPPHPKYELRV